MVDATNSPRLMPCNSPDFEKVIHKSEHE